MARRSQYEALVQPRLVEIAAWCRDGLTMDQVAANLGVGESTLYSYRNRYPEFQEALKVSREIADIQVENALYREAVGYHYTEEMVTNAGEVVTVRKFARPSTTAQIFWLKNRKPANWRDKQELQHSGTISLADVLQQAWERIEEDAETTPEN